MTQENETLVIVYQFGKVASTSLVNALNRLESVEAVQCHFLGESALQRIVPIAVDKKTDLYFHEHLSGQLAANVALTYRMNRIAAGEVAGSLKLISLSRHPLSWLRSGIQQDITGYQEEILAFARRSGQGGQDDAQDIQAGLTEILDDICDLIEEFGGMDRTLTAFLNAGGKQMMADLPHQPAAVTRRFFFLALRPMVWFDEHFRACFGFGLGGFEPQRGFWQATQNGMEFLLLRYEDLQDSLIPALASIGVPLDQPLSHDNVSAAKPFAHAITNAFCAPSAVRLSELMLSSDYSTFFDYAAPELAVAAAE